MKAVACLLLFSLAGLVSAQYAFKPGKSYVYKVRGRLMGGISHVNTQYAGLEMEYEMRLQVVSPTTIVLKPQNFKASDLNAELDGGWREAELEHETPVEIKPELLKFLESPIELTVKDGMVESIKVEDYLPTWAVNIKKAQASYFVLDTTGARAVLTGNLNRQTNAVRPEDENTDSGFFYEVMENTVLGECETYYTVSQQGAFQAPYPLQSELQPGEVTSDEKSKEESPSAEEQDDEEADSEAFQKKYYYAPGQESQSQYRYYQPQAARQYYAYRQYAANDDSQSAEDSRETREGELPWPKAFDKFCNKDDQVYEIVKYLNFTACTNKPTLMYSTSSGLHDRGGDNTIGTAFDRFVTSRYLACGKDRKQYTILSIKQEEQFNVGLRLTQKTMVGSMTNFTLQGIYNAQIPIKVQSPKVIDDLSYTFDPQEQRMQKQGRISHGYNDEANDNDSEEDYPSTTPRYYAARYYASGSRPATTQEPEAQSSEESEETKARDETFFRYDTAAEGKGFLPKPSMLHPPVNPYLSSALQTSGMKKRIQDLMKEIVEDILINKQSMAEAETLSKISTVCKILRYLNYADIEELYEQLAAKTQTEEDQTSRNIFLDCMAIAGTNPNIKQLVDRIQKKEISGEPAAQLISSFPMYIRTPTDQIINAIFELADSSALEDQEQVKTAAILAASNLIYEACVNSRIGSTKYPVQLYGEFCEAKRVARLYAPYFIKNFQKYLASNEQEDKHWAATYLIALGNLGIEEAIPEIQKVLDDEVDPYYKVMAVFALKHLIISRSANNIQAGGVHAVDRQSEDLLTDEVIERKVLPVLVSVMNDRSEHPEVRMAAVSLLVYNTNADITIYQQIAYTTWHPSSQELHSFIYSTLKNLAELERPLSPLHQKMSIKARAAFPLVKPFNGGYAKSANYFYSQWLKHVQTGYLQHFNYFGSKDSIFPNYMYYRHYFNYGNGARHAFPIEVDIQGQTIQRLASFMAEQFMQKTSVSEPHPELEAIFNVLGISQREQDEKPEASLRIKLRDQMERLWSINEESIQQLIAQAKADYLPQLFNGLPFNYQKTLHLVEHSLEMPSCTGLPIHYHLRMPIHLSLRGTLKVVNQNGLQDVQVQAEIHPVYAWKTHGKMAIKVPFSGKAYEAGVMRHAVVETPLRALVRKAPEGHIVFAISPSPLSRGTPSGEIDLFTFHQKPYTAIITDECWPTVHKEGGKMEIVHAVEEPYKNSQEFESLQEGFGINLELEEETEYHDQNETPSGWTRFFQRFHTPGCYFNVGWLGAENVRYVQRKLTLDVSKSDSKTLGFAVGYDYRDESVNFFWKDSESSSSESSEERASRDANRVRVDSSESKPRTRGDRRQAEADDSDESKYDEGRVVAVAFIGKQAPIKSVHEIGGKIQKIFAKENPSTYQYLVQVTDSEGRFHSRAAAGEAANEAAESLPQSHPSLVAIKKIVADAQNQKSQPDYCVEFEGEYDAPDHANSGELIVLRKRLLQDDLEVKVKGELQFGPTCSRMPHQIKVQGKMERGPKMTEWAKSKSPRAQKCEEDEKKGFSVSPVCQYVAEQQAAALNQATFKIKWTPLPVEFVNRTYDVEDFVKAYLYPYLSNDQFHDGAGQGQMQVDFHMLPNKEFIDVTVTKPNSRFSFRSMKTNEFTKAFLPLTATQSLANNLADRLLRSDSEPSCSIEGNTVNTFDNVTYRFHENVADDCYQVLVKDCSGREPVAVLLKDATAQKKEVVLLLGGQTKIELNLPEPRSQALYGRGKIQVELNEQRVESLPKRIFAQDSGEEIARIEAMEDGGVQVLAKQFQLATNGKFVYVQAHNSLRNRTCGLCGDFDGEKVGEFRGPKDCALSSGSLLVASYSFQSLDHKETAVCKIHQHAKTQLKHEQELCLGNDSPYQPNLPRMYAYAYQQQRQEQRASLPDEECIKKYEAALRQIVFDLVNNALKPFEWVTASRERLAHTITDTVMNKIERIVSAAQTVQEISQKVQETVCDEAKKMQIHSLAVDAICKTSKGIQEKAYKYYLNPIAQQYSCSEPLKDFNAVEVSKQIQYATYDESDQDDSPIPWIPAHQLPFPCQEKLELTLSISAAKVAYYLLLPLRDIPEAQRKQIVANVRAAVVEAVRKVPSNDPDFAKALIDEMITLVDAAFPDMPGFPFIIRQAMHFFLKRYTPFVLVKLCKVEKCCFPQPHQQQQYYQYPQAQQQQYHQYPQAEQQQYNQYPQAQQQQYNQYPQAQQQQNYQYPQAQQQKYYQYPQAQQQQYQQEAQQYPAAPQYQYQQQAAQYRRM